MPKAKKSFDDRRFLKLPHVLSREDNKDLVLLDLNTGEIYTLTGVARFVWEELETSTIGELCDALCNKFNVTPAVARTDINDLLASLSQANLVQVAEAS